MQILLERHLKGWASPAMPDEYMRVLDDSPEFLAELTKVLEICYPITCLDVIRHEPDNRFLECALACGADFLLTVNTARGHFDRKSYEAVHVITPGRFLALPEARRFIEKIRMES